MTRKTRVVMQKTTIKFHNILKNRIEEIVVLSKANAKEARAKVEGMHPENTYISKSTENDSFLVDSVQLYALKGS